MVLVNASTLLRMLASQQDQLVYQMRGYCYRFSMRIISMLGAAKDSRVHHINIDLQHAHGTQSERQI